MKKIIFVMLTIIPTIGIANKSPDWWCRVGSENESFLGFGNTQDDACADAKKQCKEQCEIIDFGEW